MKILVTGAAGFVGRSLVRDLVERHEVVAFDRDCSLLPARLGLSRISGDLIKAADFADALGGRCDAVVHLATVPGGAAEQDPELAWGVNVAGTATLLDALARNHPGARFIQASSIAVFGNPLPACVNDSTPLRPTMLYGSHKAMMEQWAATHSRRGTLDALSLRLPGIVARPVGPSGMKSAFLSNLFHAAITDEPFVVPVSGQATTWLMSLDCVVQNLVHAVERSSPWGEPYAITLPAVRVALVDLILEVSRQSGCALSQFSYEPDPELEAGFGAFPPLSAPLAQELGFRDDGTIDQLVRSVLSQLRGEGA